MQFTNTLALCAAILSAVAEGRIAFTTLPSSVKVGSTTKLTWEGSNNNSPVTITLKQGEPNNLQTVALITGSATGNSYNWTPSSSLASGSNYALQITQDETDINYTGLFAITGGSKSGGSSSSGSGSASESAAASSALPPSSSNATATTTAGPIGTGVAPSAGATGGSASRNTTLSRATLSSSRTTSTASASTTSGEGEATETASASATASPTGAAVTLASNFGLLLAGFAAVVYLG